MATETVTQSAALDRARSSNSTANFGAIYAGFTAKGIPYGDITPRVNVLTFNAWKALGRRRAQGRAWRSHHDLGRNDQDRTPRGAPSATFRRPKTTTVFHISQTDPVAPIAPLAH